MRHLISRHVLASVVATTLSFGLFAQVPGVIAEASARDASNLRVGHTVRQIVVPGSTQGEQRQLEVHLWYPADHRRLSDAPKAVYRSALHRDRLSDDQAEKWTAFVGEWWEPLSWEVEAEIAREDPDLDDPAIDGSGKAFPVIVFSHGSVNDPYDYAHTLERIAGEGFVVAAPSHVNNTQDDVRIDFINRLAGVRLFECRDGREPDPPPAGCSRASVPRSMEDRVRDISAILNALPDWLGDRADVSRAGVMGHSRGTVSALAAAGGSTHWGFGPVVDAADEPRVRAVMGMAIAIESITVQANLTNVTVPTLLVAGTEDRTSPQAVSGLAYDRVGSEEKAFVAIEGATHRSFDSTYCDQMQASGAVAQDLAQPNMANPRKVLDLHSFREIVAPARVTSGAAKDYCSYDAFRNPVDIRPLVASLTGVNVTRDSVPGTGLETDEVKAGMTELAASFFGTVLKRVGNDGTHFTRHLAPKWLEKHEPMIDCALASAGADAIFPPGQEVVCED
jgi:predicted dienelactone hydrolase